MALCMRGAMSELRPVVPISPIIFTIGWLEISPLSEPHPTVAPSTCGIGGEWWAVSGSRRQAVARRFDHRRAEHRKDRGDPGAAQRVDRVRHAHPRAGERRRRPHREDDDEADREEHLGGWRCEPVQQER